MSDGSTIFSFVALIISALALSISAVTAWLTMFRRGTVRMTQPTVIFFGPDGPREARTKPLPKVFLRTLLFSTSKRGRIIENMYVTLSCEDISRDFNVWAYGREMSLCEGAVYSSVKRALKPIIIFLFQENANRFSLSQDDIVSMCMHICLGIRIEDSYFHNPWRFHQRTLTCWEKMMPAYISIGHQTSCSMSAI